MSEVTVITPSLPDRSHLREEAIRSVAIQTIPAADHLVGIDHQRIGGWRMRNLLASAVDTKWTQILDDDDLLLPNHIETMLDLASGGADVIYSPAQVIGDQHFDLNDQPFDAQLLRSTSIVSHVAMVRTELVLDLGGWDAVKGYDWRFWIKALDAGARFARAEDRTWIYRLTPDWVHESRP